MFRSVSLPTPTYYSHLVADRARKHYNEMASKDAVMSEAREAAIKKQIEEAESIPMYFV